ncbi:unnamed protein product [Dicrocoelium dendriticum]|nr:unnamed protein product [Dicrocoelium dendriticum]
MRPSYSLLNMYRSLHITCTFVLFLLSFCDPQRVQVIYEGQNIVFYCNATGILNLAPVHYQWELDNRVIIASDDHFYLRNVQKSDEGEYKCKAIQIIDGESVVGVESTFISVRRADSIVEQDVEEGFLVRILCNVTEADRPEDAGPIRFEWRNPNGTLVGTQWKLELGHIRIHESGVYVCRVSYELDGKQMSTSSATKINVLKRAGIVFPGLIDHVLSVLETGDILQECKVISSKPSEYAYQWFRLNNQPISNSAYLQKDYVLRPRDEGIYTCVATPVDPGRSVVENNLVVTIIPLRFRIDVIDEDLKLDGFSRRRIVQIPPSDPSLNSRETFTFQWFKPDGAIVSQGPGPDMHVNFRSPEDFGRYFVRVRGANSGYHRDLSTYINLDDGIVAPTYTVVIREVSGPLYFNSRLELECTTNPPNPSARINWLGPDGLIISDSSRLVFDRFQLHNQGRYTCQILLPNQVVLRQNVELTASGSGAEVPETGGRYTIAIVQTPLVFRYNDAVRLSCVVSPDPPFVQFEWMKDGHIIGRDSELFIPNFGPRDVGRYLCKARIEGGEDLSSNTTISPRPTPPGSTYISVRPEELHQPTFSSFQIECISNQPGMLPVAQLPNGTPLETDDQFQVFRPDKERLTISAPRGLSGVYNGYRIRCVLPGLEYTEATLYIMDPCPLNESQCRSKECIPTMSLCDGRPHCRDASDEGNEFCNAGVIASPTKIIVRPNQSFTLKCHTQLTSERPYARFQLSEDNVELDRRFTAIQPATNVLFVTAPKGLTFKENDTRIECYIPGKGARVTIVNVLGDMCPPGWLLCRDGKCLSPANVCDGIPQCSDGADERQCAESCRPPNIACPSGECITPAMRCDGRRDCADNFDEQGCSPACSSLQFTCRSGECVASGSRCNGRRDCVDGSDEWGCSRECPPPNFQCPSGECVPPEKRCDGQQDCQDGFDEQNCYIPVGCNPDQYACASGECVSIFLRCNGRPDCRDGSDEHSCVVGPSMYPDRVLVRPYASMEISCRSDRAGVQPIMIVGDGIPVERHPRFSVTRPNVETIVAHISGVTERDRGLQLRCSYQTGESTIREIIIDSPCQDFELMCRDGACMRQDRFCDGRTDCRDGSDEGPEHCGSGPALVPERPIVRPYGTLELECRSGRTGVQPQLTLLNGTSVEHLPRFTVTRPSTEVVFARLSPVTERDRGMRLSCSYPHGVSTLIEILVDSPCPPSEVMCRDGSCVHEDYLCNGRSDCPDGSDEQDPHCREYQYTCL